MYLHPADAVRVDAREGLGRERRGGECAGGVLRLCRGERGAAGIAAGDIVGVAHLVRQPRGEIRTDRHESGGHIAVSHHAPADDCHCVHLRGGVLLLEQRAAQVADETVGAHLLAQAEIAGVGDTRR